MEGKLEYILCAAIWYKDLKLVIEGLQNQLPSNLDRGIVFCGFRHHHCMYSMIAITGKKSVITEVGEYEQGFLTSKNRFVSREEGLVIAYDAKQINQLEHIKSLQLFSEDIY